MGAYWGPRGGNEGVTRVAVLYAELDGSLAGFYDHATGDITVDPRLPKVELHATVTHEGFHKLLGHGPCKRPVAAAREIVVENMTAEYYISFRSLLGALTQCGSVKSMAKYLNVDEGLVYARFLSLTPLEQTMLNVCGRACIGINTRKPSVTLAA